MKKIITFILATIAFVSSYAQLEVYKTVEDFKNNTPQKYVTSAKVTQDKNFGSFKTSLKIKQDGQKDVEILLSEIWGYKYKNVLFRCFNFTHEGLNKKMIAHAALISTGKFCYWECGEAVMDVLENPEKKKGLIYMSSFYFSNDTLSDIVQNKDFRPFFNKDFATYKPLCDEAQKNGQSVSKYKNIKMGNMMFHLGGEDGIAYVKIFAIGKEMEYIRQAVKTVNGNLNSAITGSKFVAY